jgi:hypothetical protein
MAGVLKLSGKKNSGGWKAARGAGLAMPKPSLGR